MKFAVRTLLIVAVCSVAATTALAQRRSSAAPQISGVYEKFSVGEGSGDLEGMRVVIFAAGEAWHAIVQIAQGGAGDPNPVLADVTVNRTAVEFTVDGTKYTGTLSAAGLKIKGGDLLKRQPNSKFFDSRP
jgi:hypothetical protein